MAKFFKAPAFKMNDLTKMENKDKQAEKKKVEYTFQMVTRGVLSLPREGVNTLSTEDEYIRPRAYF